MRTKFVAARGNLNVVCVVLSAIMLLIVAGCGGTPETIQPPQVLTAEFQAAAVMNGVQALSGIRREHVLAAAENRAPDYAASRAELEAAVNAFRPSPTTLPTPQYEPHAAALESALAAVVKLETAQREEDARDEAVAWVMFNQSVNALLFAIGPRNPSAEVLEQTFPAIAPTEAAEVTARAAAKSAFDKTEDISQPGSYESGRWKYTVVVTSPGSKSEGLLGKLYYDSIEVDDPPAPGDFYRTPWGDIVWAGNPVVLWGEHGWMPRMKGVTGGNPLPEPSLTRGPVVMAMVLRDADEPQDISAVAPWVREGMARLGVEWYVVEQNWFPLSTQAVTLHDTKMLGTLTVRLAPPREKDVLGIIIDGSDPRRIDFPRKNEATIVVRQIQSNVVATANFYLAFQVKYAAPDYPAPADIGIEAYGKTIAIKGVRDIVISLPGDRSSGNEWVVTSVVGDSPWKTSVRAVGRPQFTHDPTDTRPMSQTGVFENFFRVIGTGRTTVTLQYRNDWETEKQPEQTFTVTLDVIENSTR